MGAGVVGSQCGYHLRWWASGVPQPVSAHWCHWYSRLGLLALVVSCKTQGKQESRAQPS